MNGTSSELEAMKQEILKEMRKEISKAKQEIIEGKKKHRAILHAGIRLMILQIPVDSTNFFFSYSSGDVEEIKDEGRNK